MCVVAFEAAQLTVKEEDQRAEILAVLGMVSYQDGQLEDAKAFLFQWSVTVTSSNGLSLCQLCNAALSNWNFSVSFICV